MLDIGFPELLLVTLVILLVFGPERLPEVLRTLGGWIGQARRSFTSLKTEIEREIGADEIRRDLHNARILEEADKVREEIKHAGAEMRASQEEIDTLMRKRMAGLQAQDQAASDALPDTSEAKWDGSPTAGEQPVSRDLGTGTREDTEAAAGEAADKEARQDKSR